MCSYIRVIFRCLFPLLGEFLTIDMGGGWLAGTCSSVICQLFSINVIVSVCTGQAVYGV